jgi:hypothetical protein
MSCVIEPNVDDPELDTALRQLVRAGWNIVVCGVRTAPDALIAYRQCELWADVTQPPGRLGVGVAVTTRPSHIDVTTNAD